MRPPYFFLAFLCFSVFGFANNVVAEEKAPNPVSEFIALAQLSHLECKLAAQLDLLNAESGKASSRYENFTKCSEKNKDLLKVKYKGAKSVVTAGKSQSATLLKDFYAFWLTTIDGLIPLMDERKFAYEARVNSNEAELDRLGNRLKIELDIE